MDFWQTANGAECQRGIVDGGAGEAEATRLDPGSQGFLGTDPCQCILCGNRLHVSSADSGRLATELLSERGHRIAKKRWLQMSRSDQHS